MDAVDRKILAVVQEDASLSVAEIDANLATAVDWMLAVSTANNRRSHVENGAVTGDAASRTNIHAQALRIIIGTTRSDIARAAPRTELSY